MGVRHFVAALALGAVVLGAAGAMPARADDDHHWDRGGDWHGDRGRDWREHERHEEWEHRRYDERRAYVPPAVVYAQPHALYVPPIVIGGPRW